MNELASLVNATFALARSHPRELAAVILFAGWGANWLSGVVDAGLRGVFAVAEVPRILKTQLASVEALAVFGSYGVSFLAVVADVALHAYRQGAVDAASVDFVANRLLDIAAAASALYAIAIWHEVVLKQLPDIAAAGKARLLGQAPPPKRNEATVPWWVARFIELQAGGRTA